MITKLRILCGVSSRLHWARTYEFHSMRNIYKRFNAHRFPSNLKTTCSFQINLRINVFQALVNFLKWRWLTFSERCLLCSNLLLRDAKTYACSLLVNIKDTMETNTNVNIPNTFLFLYNEVSQVDKAHWRTCCLFREQPQSPLYVGSKGGLFIQKQ